MKTHLVISGSSLTDNFELAVRLAPDYYAMAFTSAIDDCYDALTYPILASGRDEFSPLDQTDFFFSIREHMLSVLTPEFFVEHTRALLDTQTNGPAFVFWDCDHECFLEPFHELGLNFRRVWLNGLGDPPGGALVLTGTPNEALAVLRLNTL